MRLAIATLLLVNCGSQAPEHLVRINHDVSTRATCSSYAKSDWRYLEAGDTGNCAAHASTKMTDIKAAGREAMVKVCQLWDGQWHAYTVSDGWALDNRFAYPIRGTDVGCKSAVER